MMVYPKRGGVGGMSPHVPRGATALPSAVAKRIVLGLRAGGLEGGVGGMSPHKSCRVLWCGVL